jgi:hypothetical protein
VKHTPREAERPEGAFNKEQKGEKMFDTIKLSNDELKVLATYILPHQLPPTDHYDQLCADLAPFGIKKLKGTIGKLTGKFYNDYFLRSPYWQIIASHYRKQGICPLCHEHKTLVIYSPAYRHLGINHLHPEDVFLACGDCHHLMWQFLCEHRFWRPLKDEEDFEVQEFLNLLKKVKNSKM